MTIDWILLRQITGPVVLLFIGGWVSRFFERRPMLISYYLHSSACRMTPAPPAQPVVVHTHAVTIKNDGNLPATNVRLHHFFLPDFSVFPTIPYTVDTLPDGTRDIVIPTLVAKEQITITYLYFPPLIYSQINAGIRSDQGFARPMPMLMQRQYPKWFYLLSALLTLIGAIALVYVLWVVAESAWRPATSPRTVVPPAHAAISQRFEVGSAGFPVVPRVVLTYKNQALPCA